MGSWRRITKQDLYIDGLNNSEDTTIQSIINVTYLMTQQLREDEHITGTQGTDLFSKRTVTSLFSPISLFDNVAGAMSKANKVKNS